MERFDDRGQNARWQGQDDRPPQSRRPGDTAGDLDNRGSPYRGQCDDWLAAALAELESGRHVWRTEALRAESFREVYEKYRDCLESGYWDGRTHFSPLDCAARALMDPITPCCLAPGAAECDTPVFGVRKSLPSQELANFLTPHVHAHRAPVAWLVDQGATSLGGAGWKCEENFIRMAWALLIGHIDVVEWALCVAGASERSTECLLKTILTGSRPDGRPVEVVVRETTWLLPGYTFWSPPWEVEVNIDRRDGPIGLGGTWFSMKDRFCNPTSEAERICAAIDMAALLLHEVGHLCGQSFLTDRLLAACPMVRVVQNTFRWAMFELYPDARSSPCCEFLAETPGGGEHMMSPWFEGCG